MKTVFLDHHPVFDRFAPHRKDPHDWLGARFGTGGFDQKPALNEELFEWIAMLRAVTEARERGRFTMLELGAGFGRWGIFSALAAQRAGIEDIEVRLVEGEPQHARWARENVSVNGLAGTVEVIEAALSNSREPTVPFAIAGTGLNAENWWGQAVVTWESVAPSPTAGKYFGRPVHRSSDFAQIYVPAVSFAEVIAGLGPVDLIDADLQGAESELLPWIGQMTKQVRLVHIGTHNVEVEDRLRAGLERAGWECLADYSLQGERDTPFGRIAFGDGVQTWRNPHIET